MSQKSILSFFKHADKNVQKQSSTLQNSNKTYSNGKASADDKSPAKHKPAEVNVQVKIEDTSTNESSKPSKIQKIKEEIENDSPIKKTLKRKAKIIESDEESDEAPEKVSEVEEKTEAEKPKLENGLKKLKEESSEKENEKTASSKKRKKDKLTNETSPDSTKKVKPEKPKEDDSKNSLLKHFVVKEKKDEPTTSSDVPAPIPNSSDSNLVETIPKRKTARKSMKAKVKEEKEESNKIQDLKSEMKSSEEALNVPEENEAPKDTSEVLDDVCKKEDSEPKPEKIESDAKPCEIKLDEELSDKKTTDKSQAVHPLFGKNKTSAASTNETSNTKKINTSTTSSGVIYDPSKNKYHPIDDACWKHKEKVPYLALAKTLELIENTSARLKIIEILSNFFRSVIVLSPEDLLQSVYLCLNRIAPEYEGIELGIGDMLLMKAVAQATGRTLDKIRAEVKEKGDLGLVAESSRGNQKVMFAPPKLTVSSVFSKFKEIAKMSGNAVMAKKTDKIQLLFVACRDCEARYIIRTLSGKLRIGLAEQSVLAALGRAVVMTPPGQEFPPKIMDKSAEMSSERFKKLQDEKVLILKTTYCECPNYDLVIPVLLKEGIDGLPKHCQLSPGCPLKPMLAHPTAGVEEVLRRFDNNEFTCEFKYDGERAQIHRTEKGDIKIFSRNQEDNTSKYPDVITRISKALKDTTKSFILDTEAVAWDREDKQILPFQILSTRKKKDAVESEIVVQVCIMAFDLLFLNGESLVKKTLKERRDLLHSSFSEVENEFMFVTYKDGNNAETMQEFLDESIKGNCEGLMVKALEVDASYEIAKRSHNWLKLKKDYLDGVGDTLDLVVIGGYHGKGKRTGTYGGFLLACYDDENEEFQSICKLGTGFKEDELEAHTKFLKQQVITSPKSYYRYDSSLEPDEWFEAVQVWEIRCADLSISPIHKAASGIVDPEKGISLRFPRFLKIRDDKKPEDATNSSQIAKMYQSQEQVQNMKNKSRPEEDYY